jgi:hypothetical protein
LSFASKKVIVAAERVQPPTVLRLKPLKSTAAVHLSLFETAGVSSPAIRGRWVTVKGYHSLTQQQTVMDVLGSACLGPSRWVEIMSAAGIVHSCETIRAELVDGVRTHVLVLRRIEFCQGEIGAGAVRAHVHTGDAFLVPVVNSAAQVDPLAKRCGAPGSVDRADERSEFIPTMG